jgi:hypothetical protein
MTIETKYNVGDEVWFQRIVSGEIVSDKIRGVVFVASASKIEIWYRLEGYMDLYEYELFPAKEELLKSL